MGNWRYAPERYHIRVKCQLIVFFVQGLETEVLMDKIAFVCCFMTNLSGSHQLQTIR